MTATRPQPPERPATVPWRAVALRAEHGGWRRVFAAYATAAVALAAAAFALARGLAIGSPNDST